MTGGQGTEESEAIYRVLLLIAAYSSSLIYTDSAVSCYNDANSLVKLSFISHEINVLDGGYSSTVDFSYWCWCNDFSPISIIVPSNSFFKKIKK